MVSSGKPKNQTMIQSSMFLTSDIHLFHAAILKFEPEARPFTSVDEMNEAIVVRWNNIIGPKDVVYIAGDVSFGKLGQTIEILNQLNGRKYLAVGNHDRHYVSNAEFCKCFVDMNERYEIKYNKKLYTISHYPQLSWNKSHIEGASYMLFGHEHSRFLGYHNMLNIGMDCHNLTPLHIEEIPDLVKNLPVNPYKIRTTRAAP